MKSIYISKKKTKKQYRQYHNLCCFSHNHCTIQRYRHLCIFTIYTTVCTNVVLVLKPPQHSAVSQLPHLIDIAVLVGCKNAYRLELTCSKPSGIEYVQQHKHGHNFAAVSIPLYCNVLITDVVILFNFSSTLEEQMKLFTRQSITLT